MSTTKKPTFTKVMTEPGTLVYPNLNAPDTKFNENGIYTARIRLSADASAKVIEKYEAALADYWPIAKEELQDKVNNAKTGPDKAKARKALEGMAEADRPYKPAYDDDGNETGEYEFNFKMPASILRDKGKATEKRVPLRPDVFDAKGNLLKNPPEIWGGTQACVAGELRPYSTQIGVGLSMRLKAVQILKLSQGGGDRSSAGYGFGSHADGYEGGAAETSGGFQDRSSAVTTEAGGDSDTEEF